MNTLKDESKKKKEYENRQKIFLILVQNTKSTPG